MIVVYIAFLFLMLLCAVIQYISVKTKTEFPTGKNSIYRQFLQKYCAGYCPVLFADWLQGPYLYKLYSHYGFQEDQIAVLYICGFASNFLLGVWAPYAANKFGRKKLCIFLTFTYSLSCFLKLSSSYGILIIGRILGGISTALLSTSFEAWYLHEHIEIHDFPKEWISVTFSLRDILSGSLAVLAGVCASVLAEWLNFGPVSPFLLAIPFLFISAIVIFVNWSENFGTTTGKFSKSCWDGWKKILSDPKIFLIGIIQSSFESVIYIFIFIWTPIMDKTNVTLGIVFSSFMLCILIGSGVFHICKTRHVPDIHLLCFSVVFALLGTMLCVVATHPDNMNFNLVFLAFLLIELSVGIYFPSMGSVRQTVITKASLSSVLNWFRIPLNLFACIVLMMLHNETFRHGNRWIFFSCSGLLSVATVSVAGLIARTKQEQEMDNEVL